MSTDTSLIITFIDSAKSGSRTKAIKNINPAANATKLVDWAKAMVRLTTNSYVSTSIVYKIKLD